MLTIQSETYDQCIAEVLVIAQGHYEEIETDREVCSLVPNHAAYRATEQGGMLQITTARDGEKLVGYCYFVVSPPLHHASTPHAILDMLYLQPDYRRGYNAIRLFKTAERRAIESGARKIVCGCKIDHNIGSLFQRLGYRRDEIYFCKVV